MKKVLMSVVCAAVLMSTSVVFAQEQMEQRAATFSPGLLSAPVNTTTQKKIQTKRVVKKSRTTILRFDADQITLTDAQKEILYKIAERISDRKTTIITVIAASTTPGISSKRAMAIETFLNGYGAKFQYYVRFVRPENVVPNVNDTVKIIEKN